MNSDFDALVITDVMSKCHDGCVVDGVELDVFIYNTNDIKTITNFANFLQVFDAYIIYDEKGIGSWLKQQVIEYISNHTIKSNEEKKRLCEWCKKMLARTKRNDTEGYLRWHWVLTDSLEIYCILRDVFYFGPKKTISKMQTEDIDAYNLFSLAVSQMNYECLEKWIEYLTSLYKE